MISSGEGISDLLFAVGRPPIVEEHGVLEEFPIETPRVSWIRLKSNRSQRT
jgi:hypothetical protein